ncbi:MAG: M50 family metallopeptidase, partial [Chloroflexota bacterium]|nr:M50 family metallopeptidase [Chloroflexota bacterium]
EEGEQITMLLEGDDGQREVSLVPGFNSDSGRKKIGVTLSRNLVSEVETGSAGYDAGIRPGDTIIDINGHYIYNSESVSQALASVGQGGEVHIVLLRGQEQVVACMIRTSDSAQKIMGVELHWVEGAHIGKERSSMWGAMCLGGSYIVNTPQMVAASIPLIKKDPSLALVGPIGAGQMTVELVRSFGFSNMLFMGGVISLGIALFNFIPMPPLDGGGMLVALIEGIRRGKRLSRRALHLAYSIGTSLLIAAIVLITYSDILRLISGKGFGW